MKKKIENNLISVIVPIYKVEKFLDKCVKSIVNQTYFNLEIILVDDGSPDNCPAICDKWGEKDNRIRVVHKKNGGLSDARNAGLNIATGEYVVFIDSDDWIESSMIEKLYVLLMKCNADIAECGVCYVTENGNELKKDVNVGGIQELSKIEALKLLISTNQVRQTVWNKLYKRSVIEKNSFVVGKTHEDEFWTYKVIDNAEKIVVTDDVLYNYVQRNGSIVNSDYSVKRLDGLEARVERMKYLSKYPELGQELKKSVWFTCMYHYQCALKYLNGEEKEKIKNVIISYKKQISKLSIDTMTVSQKVWYCLGKISFSLTAHIRNKLSIGF